MIAILGFIFKLVSLTLFNNVHQSYVLPKLLLSNIAVDHPKKTLPDFLSLSFAFKIQILVC